MDDSGLLATTRLRVNDNALKSFTSKQENFVSLIDAITTGDFATTAKVCKAAGLDERQTSSLIRDSAALASFVLHYGSVDCW